MCDVSSVKIETENMIRMILYGLGLTRVFLQIIYLFKSHKTPNTNPQSNRVLNHRSKSMSATCFTLLLLQMCTCQVSDPLSGWTTNTPSMTYAGSLMFTGYEPSANKIWLIGGDKERIMSYDISFNSWTDHGTFSSTLQLSMNSFNAQSYAQWGDDSIVFINHGRVRQFSFSSEGLTLMNEQLFLDRDAPCLATIYPDWMFAVGGVNNINGDASSNLQIMDNRGSTVSWSTGPNLQSSRAEHACVIHNDYLYVFGGIYWGFNLKARTTSEKIYIGDLPNIGSWSQIAYISDSNVQFHRAVSHALYNQIYLVGGRNTPGGTASRNVQIYDVASDTMELIDSGSRRLDTGRSSPAALAVNNEIYVFGGVNTNGNTEYSSWEKSNILTFSPTQFPTDSPTGIPTQSPTKFPTYFPTKYPTKFPTINPTKLPTQSPTKFPTINPSKFPTISPTKFPSKSPTDIPSTSPTKSPTDFPTELPSVSPTNFPTMASINPTQSTEMPSQSPTFEPSFIPTLEPTLNPSNAPSSAPTNVPTKSPEIGLIVDQPTENPLFTSTLLRSTVNERKETSMGIGSAVNNNGFVESLSNYSIIIIISFMILCSCCIVILCFIAYKLKQSRLKIMNETDTYQKQMIGNERVKSTDVNNDIISVEMAQTHNMQKIGSVSPSNKQTPFGPVNDLLDDNDRLFQHIVSRNNEDSLYGAECEMNTGNVLQTDGINTVHVNSDFSAHDLTDEGDTSDEEEDDDELYDPNLNAVQTQGNDTLS